VLHFYSDGFGELASRLTVQPVHCTDKKSILREYKLTRQAHLDVEEFGKEFGGMWSFIPWPAQVNVWAWLVTGRLVSPITSTPLK